MLLAPRVRTITLRAPSVRNLLSSMLSVFHKEEAAAYRLELDPVAWDYFRGGITSYEKFEELCHGDKDRMAAIVRFSPSPDWKGLDEHGNLIIRKAWRRRTH